MKWQDTENHMVLPDAGPDEPIHKEEDDGGEQRQQDTDIAKEIADNLIEAFHDIFNDDGAKFEQRENKGKWK